MSTLTKVLAKCVKEAEKQKITGRYRLGHHLMPPVGWLNDPNGLCWFRGRYHIFFQYSPFEAEGGLKFWGHYTSEDLLSWKYEGAALYPDSPYDCHGVYSGSALGEEDRMELFYTGNVKLDGDYDYIHHGRKTSTLRVESQDGVHFGIKEEVIPFDQYPEEYTCHIRDPKVWKENGRYRMVLGGRLKGDQGSVLFYRSEDGKHWEFEKTLTTCEPFGYMWECPDWFVISGKAFLSVSPQGLKREEYRFQNIYQSGYFPVKEDGSVDVLDFREWDMGFDFYAPQTFEDHKGRRILIGWMGMPDADEEYRNPTVTEGWQHCLTVPREIKEADGKLYQYPVEELKKLRGQEYSLEAAAGKQTELRTAGGFDLELDVDGEVCIDLGEELTFTCQGGEVVLLFPGSAGAGRRVRKAKLENLKKVRMLADLSAVEIYLNEGEVVFSSRFYPKEEGYRLAVQGRDVHGRLWELEKMTLTQS